MINGIKKETIVSTTEDRLTLLNWLKKLEKTLSDDTLTNIAFTDDEGNVSLVLTFEDGTTKSVAFPYNMSKFESKEESKNKVLPYINLSLSDFEETEETEEDGRKNYYLKLHLSDGIYRIAIGNNNDFNINLYGKRNDELIDLGHHYLLIHAKTLPLDGYDDGLARFEQLNDLTFLPSFSYYKSNNSNNNYVFLIVTNGIVILTDHYEI